MKYRNNVVVLKFIALAIANIAFSASAMDYTGSLSETTGMLEDVWQSTGMLNEVVIPTQLSHVSKKNSFSSSKKEEKKSENQNLSEEMTLDTLEKIWQELADNSKKTNRSNHTSKTLSYNKTTSYSKMSRGIVREDNTSPMRLAKGRSQDSSTLSIANKIRRNQTK